MGIERPAEALFGFMAERVLAVGSGFLDDRVDQADVTFDQLLLKRIEP